MINKQVLIHNNHVFLEIFCILHSIFSSLGFWYFGHFSCMIFFSFFCLAHLALQNVNKDYVIFLRLCRQKWPKTKNGMNETMNINHLFCPEVAPEVEKKSITYILTWGTSLNVTGQANIAIAKIATLYHLSSLLVWFMQSWLAFLCGPWV